jgi:hypothetical protein
MSYIAWVIYFTSELKIMKIQATSGTINFSSLLTIVFIVLKLTGQIDWSWTWVLSPIWIPFLTVALFFVIFVVIRMIV